MSRKKEEISIIKEFSLFSSFAEMPKVESSENGGNGNLWLAQLLMMGKKLTLSLRWRGKKRSSDLTAMESQRVEKVFEDISTDSCLTLSCASLKIQTYRSSYSIKLLYSCLSQFKSSTNDYNFRIRKTFLATSNPRSIFIETILQTHI